jgi:hypothetical protein
MSRQILEEIPTPNFMKIRSAILELLHSDRQTWQILGFHGGKDADIGLMGCKVV